MKNETGPKVAALGWFELTLNNSNSYNLSLAVQKRWS
jgi:hypothetical protein